MKIAFVTQPWDGIGMGSSIGIITCHSISRLVEEHEITVYAKNGKCSLVDTNKITYKYFSLKLDNYFLKFLKYLEKLKLIGSNKKPTFSRIFYFFFYALKIAFDVKKNQIEIVHIHNYSQFASVIRFINPKVKIFLHMHCEWLTQLDEKVISKRLSKVDRVIGCSNYITSKVKNRFEQFNDKCVTVENGVDIDNFSLRNSIDSKLNKEEIHFLFVGRVSPEKGLHTLLEAFNKVFQNHKNITLHIVGPEKSAPINFIVGLTDDKSIKELKRFYNGENYSEQLTKILSQEALQKVIFHGQVHSNKLDTYYNMADILVNPSFSESFGMSLIEARASGVPVIASRIGGMVEIVENSKAGVLYEAGNAVELSQGMEKLISDIPQRKLLAKRGREYTSDHYSWNTIVNKLNSFYKNV
jgi:glycosyltransferase involved in cell wall biosynthesis